MSFEGGFVQYVDELCRYLGKGGKVFFWRSVRVFIPTYIL